MFIGLLSGNGIAAALNFQFEFVPDAMQGVYIQRLNDVTTLPSGNFTYHGDYRGFFDAAAPADLDNRLDETSGQVTLVGSFDGVIYGLITDRKRGLPGESGIALDDVLLSSSTIADGNFEGTTSGGGYAGYTASEGEFTGRFVGDSGEEVIGGVIIPGDGFESEWGIFAAARDCSTMACP